MPHYSLTSVSCLTRTGLSKHIQTVIYVKLVFLFYPFITDKLTKQSETQLEEAWQRKTGGDSGKLDGFFAVFDCFL